MRCRKSGKIVRQKANFASPFNAIGVSGQEFILFFKKELPFSGMVWYNACVPFRQEGRWAYRHRTRGGMRWTLSVRRRCAPEAYGQAVWSCPPDAGVNPRVKSPGRRRLTSPVLRGDHGAAVKPLRRECRVISAYLCWPARVFFLLRVRQWVRRAPGIPCALVFREGATLKHHSGENRAAGMRRRVRNLPRHSGARLQDKIDAERQFCSGGASYDAQLRI
jgi:hypothetical protein